MTDGSNGSNHDAAQAAEHARLEECFRVHQDFTKDLWELWVKHQQGTKLDPTMFNRCTSQSLMHMAATLAVDINQTEGQFAKIARACFKNAFNKAPKFG